MEFWKGGWIREMGLKGRRTSLPPSSQTDQNCHLRSGLGHCLVICISQWQRAWQGSAQPAQSCRTLILCKESHKSDFPCAPRATRPGTHTLWFLCAFTEQLHSALSVGTGIRPTEKAPGCLRLGPWICARCVLQWHPASVLLAAF